MRSSHGLDRLDTAFDDEHLVADADGTTTRRVWSEDTAFVAYKVAVAP